MKDIEMKYPYDFLMMGIKQGRSGPIDIYLKFKVRNSKYLMIRSNDFYSLYDFDTGLWTKDRDRVIEIFDEITIDLANKYRELYSGDERIRPLLFSDASTKLINTWNEYCKRQIWDNWKPIDQKVIFQNTDVKLEDYASFKLPYAIAEGPIDNYEKMFKPLYGAELQKVEWFIGGIISGASKRLQKMGVIFGTGGSGKSTILDLIKDYLLKGYDSVVSVKDLCNNDSGFPLETMKDLPLISIDDDAKLDRLEDNSTLNSVVSHAPLPLNTKNKAIIEARFNTVILVASNTPIQISDAKSGLLRRVIDIFPTGYKHDYKTYCHLKKGMHYEIGAIAYHCLKVFEELGEDYYEDYVPTRMMAATNYFYDFLDYEYSWFRENDIVGLTEVWKRYQDYVQKSALKFSMNRLQVKNQLQDYFDIYKKEGRVGGRHVKDVYTGFRYWKFGYEEKHEEKKQEEKEHERSLEDFKSWLKFDSTESLFDVFCAECPAQLAGRDDKPLKPWSEVSTTLRDILTSSVHYVKVPLNHIVIDFDLKDENGEKSFLANWKAANEWPETYAELSKSGSGIHLHYLYFGDVEQLARLYEKDIEIKVFKGGASLRRKLTKCNDKPIATISSGLPLREVRKTINWDGVKNERMLRKMIVRNMKKYYHANTKPSVDYIYDLLEDAYNRGIDYDLTDLQPAIIQFAATSTHQRELCLKKCAKMHFKSENDILPMTLEDKDLEETLVFFDVEVYLNLFVICWKVLGEDIVHKMFNPTAQDVEALFNLKLVGFNNRKYDNHIMYAASMGYSNYELFLLSQRIIKEHDGFFGAAYNFSYTDVYDFASSGRKKSLKKFEIELGIHHQEMSFKWDEPIPEEYWDLVGEYCANDVIATEAVFNYLKGDWKARQILSAISGLTVNDTTNQHSTKIMFGDDPNPQSQFIYTNLSNTFPGYSFYYDTDKKCYHSLYRGEDPGEGGYVYAEHGAYTNVVVLDVASMHPSSIEALMLFGPVYTKRFSEIKQARIYIKHEEWDKAAEILNGALAPFLEDHSIAGDLSNALKTVINSVYGLTSAKFPNKFRDERNIDNIVAKRGALFMINLKHEVQDRGYTVAHIKTDSIKIPNATPEIIQFVMDYGKEYGYTFEHESTYEKMCLVNNAVYIAKYAEADKCNRIYGYVPGNNAKAIKKGSMWTATGAQFAQPYVFKELFSGEELEFKDYCETKSVTSALYLDMNEDCPDVSAAEKEYDKLKAKWKKEQKELGYTMMGETFENTEEPKYKERRMELEDEIRLGHHYVFVGRVGAFVPVRSGGGILLRENGDSYASVTGTSGYRWMDAETFDKNDIGNIDTSYHEGLVSDALDAIGNYCDPEWFLRDDISDDPQPDFMNLPGVVGKELTA